MNDTTNAGLPQDALAALSRGSKIEAIKIVRVKQGIGLKEAKEAVEAWLDANPAAQAQFKSRASASGGGIALLALLVAAAVAGYMFWSGKW